LTSTKLNIYAITLITTFMSLLCWTHIGIGGLVYLILWKRIM